METPKLNNIRKELTQLPKEALVSFCLRLAKYKTENKEFLHYLIFNNEENREYINNLKSLIEDGFSSLPYSDYTSTKILRKQIRIMNKHLKFVADKLVETEIALYFCDLFIEKSSPKTSHKPLIALLFRQLKRVERIIPKLEEDLQYDVQQEFDTVIDKLKKERSWFSLNDLK